MKCPVSSAIRKVPEVLRNKIYKQSVDPQWHMGGGGCWAIRKCEQTQMNATEMKMLRWIQGNKTGKDHIRNFIIREKAHIKPTNTVVMKKLQSCFDHVQRTDDDNVANTMLSNRIDGSRPRGRPKLRWMDRVKDDMKQNKTHPEWTSDRES